MISNIFQNFDIPVPACGSMYRNHADQTFFEIGSEDLENETLFYRFLIFRLRIDPRDLLEEIICPKDKECLPNRFDEGSQFFEINDS